MEIKEEKFHALIYSNVTLIVVALLLAFLLWNGCNKNQRQLDMTNALLDSLHTTRNNLGQETATRITLQTDYKSLQRINARVGSELQELQKVVGKQTVTAIIQKVVTHDTVYVATVVAGDSCNPVYESVYNDKWSSMHVFSSRDTTAIEY